MTAELDRGCVEDQPQKGNSCKMLESSRSNRRRRFLRLVSDTAATRLVTA